MMILISSPHAICVFFNVRSLTCKALAQVVEESSAWKVASLRRLDYITDNQRKVRRQNDALKSLIYLYREA